MRPRSDPASAGLEQLPGEITAAGLCGCVYACVIHIHDATAPLPVYEEGVCVCHCVWFYRLWGLIDRFTLPRSYWSQGGHLDCMQLELHTSTHGECIKGSLVYLWIKRDVKGEGANNAREVIRRASQRV